MSMTTALRYEQENLGQTLVKSMEREHERIVKDEQTAQRMKDVKLDDKATFRAHWSDNLDEASMRKLYKNNLNKISHELEFGKKSLIAMRRAALQELLEKEHFEYETELFNKGKAFYVKRT